MLYFVHIGFFFLCKTEMWYNIIYYKNFQGGITMFLRFFHNPLLLAKLTWYDIILKEQKQSTAEYKIKRIIKDVTGEKLTEFYVYNSGLSTPKLSKNGFQATAIYIPKYKEILVIFRGSEKEDISDWFYNYTGIVSGENTSQIDSALAFVRFLKRKITDFDECYKVAAGHSLGGHLATTVQFVKSTIPTSIYVQYSFTTAKSIKKI